jgi:hypothetical protein
MRIVTVAYIIIYAIAAAGSTAPALADTLTCSQWQGIRTCQSPITVTRVTPFNFGFQVRF